jgi:4-amino-4-deoxy-L-arabinose transferase-like glycosyltransferase
VVGFDRPPAGDEIDYHSLAENLSKGEGYRVDSGQLTARRPPLYPLFLSVVYRMFGPSVAWGRLAQAFLGTGIVLLVFIATRQLFTVGAAWVTAGLTAVNPFLIFSSAYLHTENLYIVLLLSGLILCAMRPAGLAWWRRATVAGVALGLADLCRPTAALVALWIGAAGIALGDGPLRRRLLWGSVVIAAVFATHVPWAARNHSVFGKWIFSTTHGGITFYQGNNSAVLEYPQYHGGVAPLHMLPGYDELKSKPEIPKDEAAREMGRRFLRENKSRIPILLWRKFARFWRFKSDVGIAGVRSGWWWSKESALGKMASSLDAGLIYAIPVIPLFALGFFAGLGSRKRFALLTGVVVMHTAVALVFHGSLRMRIPVEPVMAMFAGDVAWRAVTRLRMRPTRTQLS